MLPCRATAAARCSSAGSSSCSTAAPVGDASGHTTIRAPPRACSALSVSSPSSRVANAARARARSAGLAVPAASAESVAAGSCWCSAAAAARDALMPATRTVGASGGASASRAPPPSRITDTTTTDTSTGVRAAGQANPCRHTHASTEANQATTNVMPQIPVTDASCISGR